ncbi:glycine/sarcosine/betaine reductase selenoprotein B family protein [Desulfosediminicola flagellatus]|uniref:glycine/sarcosine/betaine reductase selenoprotein B family protein n=1 Tax=Desulfosediminicola flagellatus TaxID=2569541 RepID=UPI0010AB9F75|nr:glycine/sarcosine/betaine reductase selenoprotein B family protein [Desulfosediminicola flagellatus]
MVRLREFEEHEREHLQNLPCPTYAATPLVPGVKVTQSRVAIVSTAGLHRRGDPPFGVGDTGYRIIPSDIDPNDLVMSHISTNFDRTGFQLDMNLVFPLDRLKELAANKQIESVATYHYSFMGATDPVNMEQEARIVASLLKDDKVDAVLLVPV